MVFVENYWQGNMSGQSPLLTTLAVFAAEGNVPVLQSGYVLPIPLAYSSVRLVALHLRS